MRWIAAALCISAAGCGPKPDSVTFNTSEKSDAATILRPRPEIASNDSLEERPFEQTAMDRVSGIARLLQNVALKPLSAGDQQAAFEIVAQSLHNDTSTLQSMTFCRMRRQNDNEVVAILAYAGRTPGSESFFVNYSTGNPMVRPTSTAWTDSTLKEDLPIALPSKLEAAGVKSIKIEAINITEDQATLKWQIMPQEGGYYPGFTVYQTTCSEGP